MKVIGLVGFAGSGKDTCADILINDFGYTKKSFATPLKDILSIIFSWDRNLLEGNTPESRIWRETPDEWWDNKLSWSKNYGVKFTPRIAMQNIGTEALRNNFNDSIWISIMERILQDNNQNIVITDCRFINEIKMVESYGNIIRIRRGEDPSWFDEFASENKKVWNKTSNSLFHYCVHQIHPSEGSWIGYDFGSTIENTSIDDLKKQFDKLKEKGVV